jgi:hypothetical protein
VEIGKQEDHQQRQWQRPAAMAREARGGFVRKGRRENEDGRGEKRGGRSKGGEEEQGQERGGTSLVLCGLTMVGRLGPYTSASKIPTLKPCLCRV